MQWLLLVFGLSGAAGLLYEIAALKALTNVFGAMADAAATVLATYMAGLSLGAFLGGRVADKVKRPLVVYAIAEALIAGLVLLLPAGRDLIQHAYIAAARGGYGDSAWLKVALSSLLLLPPTLAMGATLPLLVSGWMRVDPFAARAVPRLYGANTLGAAFGVLAGTYVILPLLGISNTLVLVAAMDAAAAVAAVGLSRRSVAGGSSLAAQDVAIPSMSLRTRPFVAGALVASVSLFGMEVIWTHVLAVVVGNSAYAFGVMLFAVLSGLALGGRSAERVAADQRAAGLVRAALGLTLAVGVTHLLWDRLPTIFRLLGWWNVDGDSFLIREAIRGLACMLVVFPPTYFSGRLFALATSVFAASAEQSGRRTGAITAASTLGAVGGSLTASFWLLPQIGSEWSLRVLGGLGLVAAVLYAKATGLRDVGRLVKVGAVAAVLLVLAPRWDIDRLSDGSNVYFGRQWDTPTVLVHEDKYGGLTTVRWDGSTGRKLLLTNGKFQGDDRFEMANQRAFAAFPAMHVRQFGKALAIGLGTGVSAATARRFPFQTVDVVELSPGVIEAARRWFSDVNDGVVQALGSHLHNDDGRHFLLVTDDRFDLITIELSSIWFAGAASLYSREFYEIAKAHLAPGGVFQQWVQLHHMSEPDLASIFVTLREAFPEVWLYIGDTQGIMVASERSLDLSSEHLAQLQADPALAKARAVLPDGGFAALRDCRVLDTAGIDRFIDDVMLQYGLDRASLVSTDDSLRLEYATPRGNVLPWDSGKRMTDRLRAIQPPAPAIHASR